jgi:hypothetical protein
MRGILRTIACYALVVSILGGLWAYAVLRQRIGRGEQMMLPPANPALMRHALKMAEEEDRKEHEQQQRAAAAAKDAGPVTRVETGD